MARRRSALATRRNRMESSQAVIAGENRGRPALVAPPIVETDFAQLEDGSTVELIEDPETPSRTTLAVYKDGEVRYMQKVQSQRQILVPLSRNSELASNVRWARGIEPYGSVELLLSELFSIFDQYMDLDPMYSLLLANFVLSSWMVDQLPVAPYIAIVGPPSSGKTRLLQILRSLCRRSILTADITSAAFYHFCDRFTPTLLIDETDTAGHRSNLFHILRVGFTPGITALRKNQSFKAYGTKVVSWIQLPNDAALNSRCIVVPLQETDRRDLKKLTDPEFQNITDHLQKKLLQYRFHTLNSLTLPRVDGDDRLQGRTRDLYEAFALASGDTENCKKLVRTFEILQEKNREPLPPHQTAVLRTLFSLLHTSDYYHYDPHWASIGDLAGMVNRGLEFRGERFRITPREVGAILTSLGITNRKRFSWGWKVWLEEQDAKRIHDLVFRYGLDNNYGQSNLLDAFSEYWFKEARTYSSCEYCRALHHKDAEIVSS